MTARPQHRCGAWLVAALAVALGGAPAGAQTRGEVRPSVAVGAVLDDNVLSNQERLRDVRWRIAPGLEAWIESERASLWGSYGLQAERFQRNPGLSHALAGQTGEGQAEFMLGPTSLLFVAGAYTSSRTPSDLNLATGIIAPGLLLGSRTTADVEATRAVTPRTELGVAYGFTRDGIEGGDPILMHEGEARVDYRVAERTTVGAGYLARRVGFDDGGSTLSHLPRARVEHQMTTFTRLEVLGGPRITDGDIAPEAEVLVARRSPTAEVSLAVALTQATALSVDRLLDVARVTLGVSATTPAGPVVSAQGGWFTSTDGTFEVTAYRVGGGVSVPIGDHVAIDGSYDFSLQRRTDVGAATFPRLHRNVALLQLRITPAAGPVPRVQSEPE